MESVSIPKPISNKETFKGEYFNLHIFHKGMIYDDYGLMFGPISYAHPPVKREELKALADFINNYLETN